MTEKAIKACRDYTYWTDQIRMLSRAISEALDECPEHPRYAIGVDEWGDPDLSTKHNVGGKETHLKTAYRNRGAGRATGFLGETKGWAEMMACPGCSAAHDIIQLRKHARQKLGAAKRAIRAATKD